MPRIRPCLVSRSALEKKRTGAGLPSRRAILDLPSREHRDRSRERLDGIPSGLHRRGAADAKIRTFDNGEGEIALRESEKPPLRVDSELGRAAIERIMLRRQVSEQAARVRLFRLGLLTESWIPA